MLRPAGGFDGGGGGRPPVNIEVNFLAGDNNAFKQAREDVKALKADLDSLARHQFFNGGGGGGFGPGGGGGGTIPTAPGTMPTPIPGGGGRNRPPSPNTPGNPKGPYGPPSPNTSSYLDRRDTDQIKRDHAEYLAWFAASQARYSDNARRRAADDASFLAGQAAKVTDAYKTAQATQAAVVGASTAIDAFSGGGSGRAIDHLQANINRRRQGLPDLPDPTIAAAAANVAGRGGGRAAAGAFLTGGMALPAAVLAGLVGGTAANTPQGIEAIGGFGSWLESATNEDSFLGQFGKRWSGPSGQRPGSNQQPGLWQLIRRDILGSEDFAGQRISGERVNRMLGRQAAGRQSYSLGQLSELTSTGIGMDSLNAAKAQNSLQRSQLESNFYDTRGGDSFSDTYQFGEDLKRSAIETLQLRQQELSVAQNTLEVRKREQQVIDNQVAGLAGMSKGDLRRAEKAYQSSLDGHVTDREAAALRGVPGGNDLQAVKDANLRYANQYAPGLTANLTRESEKIREASEKANQEITRLTAEIGKAATDAGDAATGLVAETLTYVQTIDEKLKTLREEMATQNKNNTVKSKQGVRAPGRAN